MRPSSGGSTRTSKGPRTNLAARPPLLVYGVGGVGKSTLIAQFLLDLAERADPTAWAYLDLDRPSLSSYDPLALLTDVVRQVGAQLPQVRRFLDYSGSEARGGALGSGLEGVDSESWRELAVRVADAVNEACDGRLVVVLDTYEELQRADRVPAGERGRRSRCTVMFSILSDYTDRFRLVVGGRAPASDFVSRRRRSRPAPARRGLPGRRPRTRCCSISMTGRWSVCQATSDGAAHPRRRTRRRGRGPPWAGRR